jgi:hypothetical protein
MPMPLLPFVAAMLLGMPPQASSAEPLREADARVEAIADRIARGATPWCTARAPLPGWVLHHLAEYPASLRADLVAVYALDQGPGIVAVAPGGAAATAGLLPGDTIVAVQGASIDTGPLPRRESREPGSRIEAAIDTALAGGPTRIAVRRGDERREVVLAAPAACATHVRIARAESENAFADGRYATFSATLVARTPSDDELAAVVAHELAHNYLGHYAAHREGRDRRPVRQQEAEADAFALRLMAIAGYDPHAAIIFFTRMISWNPLDAIGLGTHYARGKRLAALRDELTRMETTPGTLSWAGVTLAWPPRVTP